MDREYEIRDGKCVFFLKGRIVQNDAEVFEQEFGDLVRDHPECEFVVDANKLKYISSAGLRVILKIMKESGKRFTVRDVSTEVYSILEETGFTELMNVEKKLRHISTAECRFLGSGRSSNVYRLDSETIVKKYDVHVPIEMVHKEMELARKAFLTGISTAIPFDMVRADDSLGVVFELIEPADTIGNTISGQPDRFDELTQKFTQLLKQIHHTRIGVRDGFPSVRNSWMGWIEGMKPYYSADEIRFLQQMVESVPERDTLLHCDFHENNVLVHGDSLVLIDMADIGYGHPIFDLAGGAFRVHADMIPQRNAKHGLSPENMERFWNKHLMYYFGTEDPDRLGRIRDMCEAFGLVRSALFPMKHVQISSQLRQIHIDDAGLNLFPRKEWALKQLEILVKGELL